MPSLTAVSWHLRHPGGLPAVLYKNLSAALASKRAADRTAHRAERAWDRKHGVDTAGVIAGRRLLSGPSAGYVAVPPLIAGHLISQVIGEAAGFDFVDFGCGKGRALLVASRHPFRRVIGVEIDPGLARIAEQNAAVFHSRFPDTTPVEIVCQDATTYALPLNPLVLFFYNPFHGEVMRQVVRRIEQSYEPNPREIFIIYFAGGQHQYFDQPSFEKREVRDVPRDPMDRLTSDHFLARIYKTPPGALWRPDV